MKITRTAAGIEVLAPAKVNLFLEVLGKRDDGFHEIETVLCPISLFDRLVITPSGKPDVELELVLPPPAVAATAKGSADLGGPGLSEQLSDARKFEDPAWNIPADDSNLVVRAVQRAQAQLGTNQGCHIRLEKQIPAAAGLGGGSSDTAAAVTAYLIALNRWDRSLASDVCAAVGSDIPFFLGSELGIGLTYATGRGEHCALLKTQPSLEFMVTHPPVGCSTKEVYANYRRTGTPRNCQEIIASCEDGQFQKIGAELFNALQFSAANVTEWIEKQLTFFSQCGLNYAIISGSGSSCFALIPPKAAATQSIGHLRSAAAASGLSRVYHTHAWYGPSIEEQL